MPRTNIYYLPGNIWNITNRCHQKGHLLKFRKDRINWLHRLYEAKKWFNLAILNNTVNSNYIHLLIADHKRKG